MCVLRGRCMWDSRRCCLNVCVCVFVYDHLMKITKAHCHCNLLCITTTISELFGDNSEGAGTAHFSSTCHISAAASALLLLTTTHTQAHTETGLRARKSSAAASWGCYCCMYYLGHNTRCTETLL